MLRDPIRVYADTSVFGGVFEPENDEPTQRFFDLVEAGQFRLVTSIIVANEVASAPDRVRDLYERMASLADVADLDDDALTLMQAYLANNIVSAKYRADAQHVALATISRCDIIVSWNFRHIVNFRRIPMYNAVNILRGYSGIAIYSPREMVEGEEEAV